MPVAVTCLPFARALIDGRTREARRYRQIISELTAHLGGSPSAPQRALVERAASMAIRLEGMDRAFLRGEPMTESEARVYLDWQKAYVGLLQALGLRPPPAPVPTLDEFLRERDARRARGEPDA